jgi:hypothetical protein
MSERTADTGRLPGRGGRTIHQHLDGNIVAPASSKLLGIKDWFVIPHGRSRNLIGVRRRMPAHPREHFGREQFN